MNFRNSKTVRASLVAIVSLVLLIPAFGQASNANTKIFGKAKVTTTLPTVTAHAGIAPVIGKPSGIAPTALIKKDIIIGKGKSAVSSSTVTAHYVLMSWKT